MSDETCPECGRLYAVDDWWWSPDCEHLCGSRFHDSDEDATGELECRGFTIQALRAKLAQAERVIAAADRMRANMHAWSWASYARGYDTERAKLGATK